MTKYLVSILLTAFLFASCGNKADISPVNTEISDLQGKLQAGEGLWILLTTKHTYYNNNDIVINTISNTYGLLYEFSKSQSAVPNEYGINIWESAFNRSLVFQAKYTLSKEGNDFYMKMKNNSVKYKISELTTEGFTLTTPDVSQLEFDMGGKVVKADHAVKVETYMKYK